MRQRPRFLVLCGAMGLVGCGDNLAPQPPVIKPPAIKHCAPHVTWPEVTTGDPRLGYDLPGGALAAGDLDEDGHSDVIGVVGATPGLELRLGNGDGTFRAPSYWPVGRGAYALGVADFDGDNRDDVLVYNAGGGIDVATLQLLISNGDGTVHQAWSVTDMLAGTLALHVADLNRDGDPDFILGRTIYLGNGDGTFVAQSSYVDGDGVISTADLDHDGVPDVAAPTGSMCATWNGSTVYGEDLQGLLGSGDGTFRAAMPSTGTCVNAPVLGHFMLVADVDGDELADAVGTDRTYDSVPHEFVVIRKGLGDGIFEAQPTWFDIGFQVQAIAAADFNRDGNIDLVLTSDFGTATVLLGTGGGNFGPPASYQVSTTAVEVTDVNGDGATDIAAGALLLGIGDGTFEAWRAYGGSVSPGRAVLGDLDADGFPDLATGQQVFLDNGDGSFRPTSIALSPYDVAYSIERFVQGSSNDLLAISSDRIDLYPGQGDGTFAAAHPMDLPLWGDELNTIDGVAVGDVNNDGLRDVVVSGHGYHDPGVCCPAIGYSGTFVLLSNGGGSFLMASGQAEQGVGWGARLALADLDGDGRLDLVSAGQATTAAAGDGQGRFTVASTLNATDARGLAVADLTGDGVPDVVIGTSSELFLLRGLGGLAFADPTAIASGSFSEIAIGDVDGDGEQDLVVVDNARDGLTLFAGNGDGTFTGPNDIPGVAVRSVSLSDVDGDGSLDIANASHAAGILLGSCTTRRISVDDAR